MKRVPVSRLSLRNALTGGQRNAAIKFDLTSRFEFQVRMFTAAANFESIVCHR